MLQRFAFFEDDRAEQFSPLSLLRPVFDLRCGHFSLRERWTVSTGNPNFGALIRPHLAETYSESHPTARVNDRNWLRAAPTLLLNGRWLSHADDFSDLQSDTAGWYNDELLYVVVEPEDHLDPADPHHVQQLHEIALTRRRVDLTSPPLHYPWDLFPQNVRWLERDFLNRSKSDPATQLDPRVAIVGDSERVYVHRSARIDPYVVIDSSDGPVWIDQGARIQAFTRLEGPCFIGREAQLFRANIREGCSIGPVCRVGGEVEESILHGFANKYHDGFLGHSYVCPWVNLGALTTNSDLKNDYTNVRVPLNGVSVDTGSTKVGCFLGDHTKTAIGSVFNTGTSVGVMSLILPGAGLLPKHVPSFCRIWHGHLEPLPDGTESGIATARIATSRRGQDLTPAMERLLQAVYERTTTERNRALDRFRERTARS